MLSCLQIHCMLLLWILFRIFNKGFNLSVICSCSLFQVHILSSVLNSMNFISLFFRLTDVSVLP